MREGGGGGGGATIHDPGFSASVGKGRGGELNSNTPDPKGLVDLNKEVK